MIKNNLKIAIIFFFGFFFSFSFGEEILEKKEENLRICTKEYLPVCAEDENGKEKTYSNKCESGENKFLYEGECKKNIIINISEGDYVESPLKIEGNSNEAWFGFEGDLGNVELLDEDKNVLSTGILKLEEDWMENKSADFSTELNFEKKDLKKATLVFKNNNPSDNRDLDKSFEITVILDRDILVCDEEKEEKVCVKTNNKERCLKEPCPEFVSKTFINKCFAQKQDLEILHKGGCQEEEEKKEKKEKIVQEKISNIFSKYDLFLANLEKLVQKMEKSERIKNDEKKISQLKKIQDSLFLAKNKKAEARLNFYSILNTENKKEIEESIKTSEENLKDLKYILKNIFSDIKILIKSL